MDEQKPGQVVAPQAPVAPEQPVAPVVVPPTPPPQTNQWQFKADEEAIASGDPGSVPAQTDTEPVSWTASEFIAHHKSFSWYSLLALGAVSLAVLIFLVTHDKISTLVVLFAAILFGVYAGRQPRVLEYRLDDNGLTIGGKFYGYNLFKSFSVVEEGAFSGILLMPLKRFMPALTVYYAPTDGDKIMQMLADRLPMENHQNDVVDRFIHRIRF